MPQDKRRSISYRSFVTCNDPKGIECGAIRKSKKEQIKSKIETDRNQENHNLTKSLEIIKERKNDNIAKELLKGALDLQESLVMLGKLQEASSFMLGLSRKQKQKLEDCTFDGMVNGVKGLRNVVRESLVKQNVMIANPVFEEHYYDHRKMGSPDMMPSTSSSRSSMIYSSSFVHSDSCVSSPAVSVKKKGKELNLIVKLMGLESFPLSPRNYMDKEKILEMSKRMYDNDSPRAKRVQFGAQEGVMKQRSVGEIFENIKFKGLLRHKQESDVFDSENERTPIVVMKPRRYPCLDLDKPFSTKSWKEMGMKPICSKTSGREIVRNEDVYFREKYEVARGIDCEQNGKYLRKVASAKGNDSENLHSKPLKKKAENKNASVEKVAKLSDQEKFTSAKIEKRKDGKSTTKNQTLSAQMTNSTSMSDHSRKRRTVNERKNRQPALLMEENRIVKGQNKKTKAFHREDNDLKGDSKSVSPIVTDNYVKNQPHIKDSDIGSRIKLLDTPECILYDPLNDKKIIQQGYNKSARSEVTSVSTSEYCSVDQLGETQSTLNEVTLSTTHENRIAVDHNMNRKATQSLKSGIESPKKTKLNAMLLSNSLFVCHLEERFNVQVYPDFVPCVIDDDQELENSRLLLDCANEILELKSQELSQACLPFPPSYITNTGSSLCLDRLVEEVCSGIADLRGYLRAVTNESPSDNLYLILDRDLRYKSGVWGVGWRSMYTQNVVELVVGDIDRFVLNKLIEEILVDLML